MVKSRTHDVGSKTFIPLPLWVKGEATFGGARQQYRYRLSRVWDTSKSICLFVLMNPSSADVLADDRTVARCRAFAEGWGYGALLVGNTFAYRCTDQRRLLETPDPVGPDNDQHLLGMARDAKLIVFAYGTPHHRVLHDRGALVATLFRNQGHTLHVLRLSKDGVPVHPLYLPGSLKPVLWAPAF
jgi:hypothetical protein